MFSGFLYMDRNLRILPAHPKKPYLPFHIPDFQIPSFHQFKKTIPVAFA